MQDIPPFEDLLKESQKLQKASSKLEVCCKLCQTPFKATRTWNTFCSTSCRKEFHRLQEEAATRRHSQMLEQLQEENEVLKQEIEKLRQQLRNPNA